MAAKNRRLTLQGRKRRSPVPDVTPIVNVALVLLIVFMVVTPMIREGVQVATPEAIQVRQLSESEQTVILALREDGSMFVNLKPVRPHELAQELALAYRGHEGKPIVIKGAGDLPYDEIIKLMDVCKGIGATGVDLAAKKAE